MATGGPGQPTGSQRSPDLMRAVVLPGVYTIRRIARSYYPQTDFYSYSRDGELVFVLELYNSRARVDHGMLYGRDPFNLNRILFHAKYFFSPVLQANRECEVTEIFPEDMFAGNIRHQVIVNDKRILKLYLDQETGNVVQFKPGRNYPDKTFGKLFQSLDDEHIGLADIKSPCFIRESLFATVIARFWIHSLKVKIDIVLGPCPTIRSSSELKQIVQDIHNSFGSTQRMTNDAVYLQGSFPVLPLQMWNAIRELTTVNIREIARDNDAKVFYNLLEDGLGKKVLLISKDNVKLRATLRDLQSNLDVLYAENSSFTTHQEIFLADSNKTLVGSYMDDGYILDNENNRMVRYVTSPHTANENPCQVTRTLYDFRLRKMMDNPVMGKLRHAMSRHNDECTQIMFDKDLDVRIKALLIMFASRAHSRHSISCEGVKPNAVNVNNQAEVIAFLLRIK